MELEAVPLEVGGLIPGGADIVTQKFSGAGDAPSSTTVNVGGGPRLVDAPVNLIFWGARWATNPPPNPSLETIANDVAQILASPYLRSARQYQAGPMWLNDVYLVTSSSPPRQYTNGNVEDFVDGLDLSFPVQALQCVFMPPGTAPSPANLGGEHSYIGRSIFERNSYYAWVRFGSRSAISQVFSHELVEACTDPEGDAIQVNPTNPNSWNEVGDICRSVGLVNGVSVQSYWSQRDQACVIPMDIPVSKQITCILKAGRRDDPDRGIEIVGGVTVETGRRFRLSRLECIREIDRGNRFFVVGADGSQADVKVFMRFSPDGHPLGRRYIATVRDESKDDNLLSLPDCS
jgi:hypothetical protein